MSKNTDTYICKNCDHEFEIEFEFTPGVRGNTYGPPESCYPDEPSKFSLLGDDECPECKVKVDEDYLHNKYSKQYANRDDYREDE